MPRPIIFRLLEHVYWIISKFHAHISGALPRLVAICNSFRKSIIVSIIMGALCAIICVAVQHMFWHFVPMSIMFIN